ncbi:MAG: hypothetical protein ABEI96_04265 [Haloarculaceae archaeon]
MNRPFECGRIEVGFPEATLCLSPNRFARSVVVFDVRSRQDDDRNRFVTVGTVAAGVGTVAAGVGTVAAGVGTVAADAVGVAV